MCNLCFIVLWYLETLLRINFLLDSQFSGFTDHKCNSQSHLIWVFSNMSHVCFILLNDSDKSTLFSLPRSVYMKM